MLKKSSTEDNLSSIAKSIGRRQSLDINNEYIESSSSASDDDKSEIQDITPKENDSKQHNHKYKSPLGDIRFHSVSSTIFDSQDFKDSQFFGFYVLFWLGTAFYMINILVHAYFVKSEFILEWPVVKLLLKDLYKVGLTDLAMYLSTYFVFYIQYACKLNVISWERVGWIVQSVFEIAHLRFWLWFASDSVMGFSWIAKVFLVLHNLVFIMKMHSYGFYNGYLWKIMKELQFSESYLARINSDTDVKIPEGYTIDQLKSTLQESIEFCKFDLEYQSQATTIKSDAYKFDESRINESLESLQAKNIITFPSNISFFNFFEYSSFPTVVYTLHYPRNERIRWSYVFQKTCAVFGIIFLMILVAQNWMYPLVLQCIEVRKLPVQERFSRYIFILLDMIPPFLMEYLFTFFLIWDSILNAIAELTRFADREFYGPWWSCTDWSEFSRIWNVPVHKFLLRHVYHSSISSFKVNKFQAALLTFIISSIVHELVMYVIFGTLRGYLLLLQMSQIPLVMFSRTAFMKDKKVLGNIICWFGFLSGPSMICTLYLTY
ncbi:sterol O-acyltransferase 2 [Scheffersomyces coipomensis]|uniref:sterol O-acyltransferase 2 n=1 Tax=Scheffersomyces coipomensis TaxID=1788519 RepID=UPI00315CDB59